MTLNLRAAQPTPEDLIAAADYLEPFQGTFQAITRLRREAARMAVTEELRKKLK